MVDLVLKQEILVELEEELDNLQQHKELELLVKVMMVVTQMVVEEVLVVLEMMAMVLVLDYQMVD